MTEVIQAVKLPAGVGSIVVVSVLTCALFHSVCILKATQINVQHSLIQELMLYKFELDHNGAEVTKNIHCVKGKGAVDHSTLTRCLNKFAWVVRPLRIRQDQVDPKHGF